MKYYLIMSVGYVLYETNLPDKLSISIWNGRLMVKLQIFSDGIVSSSLATAGQF